MVSVDEVIEILKDLAAYNVSEYVIYPFGANGRIAKIVLSDIFNKEPALIVDNYWCNYSDEIISGAQLKEKYRDSMQILLTVEDAAVSKKLEEELSGYIPQEKITKISGGEAYCRYDAVNSLSIKNILPELYEKIPLYDGNRKIKVRFFNAQIAVWNCLESVCQAFEQDPKYDVKVVVMCPADRQTRLRNSMEGSGHEYIFDEEYDAEADQPDIFIITHAYAKLSDQMKRNIRYLKMVVVASNMLICYDNHNHSVEDFIDSVFKINYTAFNPDYYIFDSFMYEKLKKSTFFGNKLVELGNAKFDGIYETCRKNVVSEKYAKLSGKKKVLWTIDHGVLDGKNPSPNITFDVYIKKVLDFAKENKDVAFIVRPHPIFIVDMLNNGIWKQLDLEILRSYFRESENMVWDESDTYNEAFAVCDAIMVDGFCGIVCTALPLGKPVCVLYRDKKFPPLHPEITDNYYAAYSPEELDSFLGMILDGQDPMKSQREAASRKYIKSFDGKNGQRIKDFVEGKFFETYANTGDGKPDEIIAI